MKILHRKILMIFDKHIVPTTQYSVLSLEVLQEYLQTDFNIPLTTDELLREIKEMEMDNLVLLDDNKNVNRIA